MTPKEAATLVSQATEPQMAGKITREGYAQLQEAVILLTQCANAVDQLNDANNNRARQIEVLEARIRELEGAKPPA